MKKSTKSMCFIFVIYFCSTMAVFAQGSVKTIDLLVDGMVSDTCPVLLKSAVVKIDGVKKVSASLENKSATIVFDDSKTTLKDIQETIRSKVGFDTMLK